MSELITLNLTQESGIDAGAEHTAREIAGQPGLWNLVFDQVLQEKQQLQEFLNPVLNIKDIRIILTGAGSSAFIGESLQGIFQSAIQKITQAIATTDLVTNPQLYFLEKVPTLLISFARSGNSPESLETIKLADLYCERVFHLIITCNENGEIVQHCNAFGNCYIFILPAAANDKGLAMTGSFTSMLLSGMLIAKLSTIAQLHTPFYTMIKNAQLILRKYLPFLQALAKNEYERVVFLGSGPLLGIARECHLKLQELTDGQVICKHDSFLGFRHGPRVVANEKSLLVYLFSNNDEVFKYEQDLAKEIAEAAVYIPAVSVGRKIPDLKNAVLDIEFERSTISENDFYCIPPVLVGQLLGFYKSIQLGLLPDSPSASGAINRVVQGVIIYPTAN